MFEPKDANAAIIGVSNIARDEEPEAAPAVTAKPAEGHHRYDVALLISIDAPTYDDALRYADMVAEGIGQEGENVSAVQDYDYDNDGQRVLYLHPIASDGSPVDPE
jgi:hypothetical protein